MERQENRLREGARRDRDGDQSDVGKSQRKSGASSSHWKPGERCGTDRPAELLEGTSQPCRHLDFHHQPPEKTEKYISVFQATTFVVICYNIHWKQKQPMYAQRNDGTQNKVVFYQNPQDQCALYGSYSFYIACFDYLGLTQGNN
jgi:hypothetical protein